MNTFTVFIRDADNTGTTYITAVQATDVEAAKKAACAKCWADWGYDEDNEPLHVLGVAEGDVTILEWDDCE